VDALWRKTERLGNGVLSDFIPELRHRYPSYRLHVTSGRLVWEDLVLMEEISHRLKSIVGELSGGAVFAPWGIGNHIDHIITREVCLRTFSSLILWSDFPYNVAEAVRESIRPTNVLSNPQTLTLHPNLSDKKSLIRLYQTQVVAMFPRGGIPLVPEQYAVFQKEEDEFSPHFLRQPSLHREAEAHEVIAPKKY
jgi:LmbE family N-acetylglucosaminyl deacetylase